jgi:N-acylneuraminate cytidylyltransferase
MNNLAIIPARGGSKRIPKKNIKDFLGKPIISYSIKTAIQSNLFDEIMVSTDDEEIAKIAIKYGAKVPFFRSKEVADDYAILAEVVIEVLQQYEIQNIKFDNVCCILPTAPFLTKKDIITGYKKLIQSSFNCVFPVVKYSFPIQRALQLDGQKIKMIWPENLTTRSQNLKPSYHDAGLFYWVKSKMILKENRIWNDNTSAIIINEFMAHDIDTPEDWQRAEIAYAVLHQLKKKRDAN